MVFSGYLKKRRKFLFVLLVGLVFSLSFILAAVISEDLHVNVQVMNSSGDVIAGTYEFEFNISLTENCNSVIYDKAVTMATDRRGVISYYLSSVSLNYTNEYYLCYYRNGTLINSSKIVRSPYTFRARNVSVSGIEPDANLGLNYYNVTTTGWFKGLFNWVIKSASADYLNFNGTTLEITDNVTRWGYNVSTVTGGFVYNYSLATGGLIYNHTLILNNSMGAIIYNYSTVTGGYVYNYSLFTGGLIYNYTTVATNIINTTANIQALLNGSTMNFANVGIGTSAPAHKLTVVGSANITQNIYLGNALVYTEGGDMIFRV